MKLLKQLSRHLAMKLSRQLALMCRTDKRWAYTDAELNEIYRELAEDGYPVCGLPMTDVG